MFLLSIRMKRTEKVYEGMGGECICQMLRFQYLMQWEQGKYYKAQKAEAFICKGNTGSVWI